MIETPSSFAEAPAPAAAPPEPDTLSEMLRAVRLTGAVFLSARLTAPFGIVSPKRYDIRMPMAHLRHISVFHLIAEGDCVIETASGAKRQLEAGDLVLLPFADQHRFYKGKATDMVFDPNLIRQGPIEGVWTVNYGGGGQETRLVCGFLESAELFTPVFRSLPEMLVEHAGEGTLGGGLASTVREIVHLMEAATPGTQAMLGRMMELLFVEVLRRHASRLPTGKQGIAGGAQRPRRRTGAAASPRRPGAALDRRHPGARGGHVAHRSRRKVQWAAGPPADRLPDMLAHPAGGRPAAPRQGRHRPHSGRYRL